MTVTFHSEIASARSANLDGDSGSRTYTRAFRLTTDSTVDGPYAVGSNASLPVIGSVHPEDAAAYCRSISVENSDPWRGWTVTCEYSDESEMGTQPADDETKVSFSSEIYQEPVWKDINGDAVLNSAGDYFLEPPIQRDSAHLIARIEENVTTVPTWVLSYQNAINNSAITIGGLSVAQYTAKMSRLAVSSFKYRAGTKYYTVSFDVHIHYDGWKPEPLQMGYNQIASPGQRPRKIKDKEGEPVTVPQMIDDAGKLIEKPTPSNVKFAGPFEIYPELDFTVLPGIT